MYVKMAAQDVIRAYRSEGERSPPSVGCCCRGERAVVRGHSFALLLFIIPAGTEVITDRGVEEMSGVVTTTGGQECSFA